MQTTNNILAGETVFRCMPLFWTVDETFRTTLCNYCFSSYDNNNADSITQCKLCKTAHYCKVCEREKCHGPIECVLMRNWSQKFEFMSDELDLLAAQAVSNLLLITHNNSTVYYRKVPSKYKPFYKSPAGVNRTWADLMSHFVDREPNDGECSLILLVQEFLLEFFDENVLSSNFAALSKHAEMDIFAKLSFSFVGEIYGVLQTNQMGICSSDNNRCSLGMGLFLDPSIMDHSCRPTVAYSFVDGIMLQATALEPLASYRDATISYLGVRTMLPRTYRRQVLKQLYYFDCRCRACLDVDRESMLEAAVCPFCTNAEGCCPYQSSLHEFGSCVRCKKRLPAAATHEALTCMKECHNWLRAEDDDSKCEIKIKTNCEMLEQVNYWLRCLHRHNTLMAGAIMAFLGRQQPENIKKNENAVTDADEVAREKLERIALTAFVHHCDPALKIFVTSSAAATKQLSVQAFVYSR